MREILFRGKRKDNGEWVEGHYGTMDIISLEETYTAGFITACCNSLGMQEIYEIIPETLSQYILLDDKKGNKIFDGAILEITSEYYNLKEKSLYKVRYHEATASFCAFAIDFLQRVPLCQKECKYYEIIGNIHDNPELLKGGVQE